MALRRGRTTGTPGKARPLLSEAIGRIRRTQLITTYGVGSLIASDDQSFVVSGIDSWTVEGDPDLLEFRLQTRLRVSGFRLPPRHDEYAHDGVRVRRFPTFYTCPGSDAPGDGCEWNLRPHGKFGATAVRKNECATCGGPLTPSRFVVACGNGHLGEFPYFAWVHSGAPRSEGDRHEMALRTTGRTAALRSIVISCSCGRRASMEGAFAAGALRSIGYRCKGGRPWLGESAGEQGCDQLARVIQRGSSSAWSPVVRSALSIPPFSQQLHGEVYPYYEMWRGEEDDVIVRQARKQGLLDSRFTPEDVVRAVRDYEEYEAGERPDPTVVTGFEAADILRAEEYKQLSVGDDTEEFLCVPAPEDPRHPIPEGIASVMLVERLREVRVLQAFTRLHSAADAPGDRLAALSLTPPTWLPGVEVLGEGIFLRLDPEALARWEAVRGTGSQGSRADLIRNNHTVVLERRAGGDATATESPVSARYVLVHTLAHALINEWSLDAGYPAAALRERLYVSPDMAGVLIYTASSDSAGSLGGLVDQGRPAYFARSLRSAMDRATWCSADPLCMESQASGVDSLNLAACHSCVLLPETACETGNTFLDRAMLIGTPDGAAQGFFTSSDVPLPSVP